MRDAVIVSTARTPIGKAYRGAFNATTPQALAAHAIEHAVARAGVDPAEVADCIMGAALQQGFSGTNIARQAAIRAGLPVTVAGMSVDRQCASGMMAIAAASKQVSQDGLEVAIGGGVESISMVQTPELRVKADPWLMENKPAAYMTMLETAETVAERYGISGSMLARICTYLNVPRPGRGYWAMPVAARTRAFKKLPVAKEGEEETWAIDPKMSEAQKSTSTVRSEQ